MESKHTPEQDEKLNMIEILSYFMIAEDALCYGDVSTENLKTYFEFKSKGKVKFQACFPDRPESDIDFFQDNCKQMYSRIANVPMAALYPNSTKMASLFLGKNI